MREDDVDEDGDCYTGRWVQFLLIKYDVYDVMDVGGGRGRRRRSPKWGGR